MASPAIQIRDLTKTFRPPFTLRQLLPGSGRAREVVALRGITLAVPPGEIFGLVGRNGQGKTTLLKTIAALLEPTAGAVEVFGFDSVRQSREVRRRVGLVTADERSFYGRLTGWQNLLFFARLYGLDERAARRRIGELLELFDFAGQIRRRYHELSSGNRQRLALLRALLTAPPLLLLDEPTRSLDPLAADELRRLIRERLGGEGKVTVVITSHNLDEIEDLCSRVGFLERGEWKLCAAMADLKQHFADGERVAITVRGGGALEALAALRLRIPELEYWPEGRERCQLAFPRRRDDGLLGVALAHLLAGGLEILDCAVRHGGLKEIMAAAAESRDGQ